MAFKDIKGQDRTLEFFRRSVNKNRLAHAYLFSGPQGVGKSLFAQNLAKFLNCQELQKEGELFVDCCDRCRSCRTIDSFNHPDVRWIAKQDGAKEISIDEIRAAQKEFALKAYEGRFKIVIIQDADQMSEAAANCLLKTLEEPPASCIIILTSAGANELLPTIVSRCQMVRFYLLGLESLKDILVKDYKIEPGYAHFLSLASEGRLGCALSLTKADALSRKNWLIEQACQPKRRTPAANIFNIKDRQELITQIKYLLNWFRDILVLKAGLGAAYIINADKMEKVKPQAAYFTFEQLQQIIDKIDSTHRLMEQNLNPKIALEVMLGGITKCKK